MSLATIRSKYKTLMSAISGIGVVHDYERWSVDWAKFLEQFKDPTSGKILGWTITREKSSEEFLPGSTYRRTHDMVIRGYQGLRDEDGSEKTFQDLIETVCNTLRPKTTLENEVEQVAEPLQVTLVDVKLFGAVLCHYCELRQSVNEEVAGFVQT